MSMSDAVARHIPFLRRFARALSGTQAAGDAYVVATLEAIVADPGCLDFKVDPKIALYKLFLQEWRSVPVNREVDAPMSDETQAARNIASITPEPRIAFLLHAMELFSLKEIAQTLQCSERKRRNWSTAPAARFRRSSERRLIIEDEPLIAADIKNLVEQLGHDVTTIARTHGGRCGGDRAGRPGLILSDIQLADGSSGLEAVNEILDLQHVPVIFITGYPRAVSHRTGARTGLPHYQALHPDTAKAVISQALFFDRALQASPASAAS